MDDHSGWHEVLVEGWGPLVRAAVVERVERSLVGRRGVLVRALGDRDEARYAWTEEVHRAVLDGIRAETGADLDELGSQAAWSTYEDVWHALAERWAGGGTLGRVPTHLTHKATTIIAALPTSAATAAGADIGVVPAAPLQVAGQVRIDVEGLHAFLAMDPAAHTARGLVDDLIAIVEPAS